MVIVTSLLRHAIIQVRAPQNSETDIQMAYQEAGKSSVQSSPSFNRLYLLVWVSVMIVGIQVELTMNKDFWNKNK